MDTRLKRSFYETTGYDFRRKVIPSLINQDTSAIKAGQTKTQTNQINRLQTIEKNLYSTYEPRKDSIADHKQQDPKLASDLVNILMKSDERLKTIKKVHKTMCTILAKQAGNVSESIRCPIDA